MTDRATEIDRFLRATEWLGAERVALAGDASSRQYLRLTTQSGDRAVLMDDPTQDTVRFAQVAEHLTDLGFSAPRILAHEEGVELMLLEDLGDAIVAHVCQSSPGLEPEIYDAIVDTLVDLHQHPAPQWAPRFTSAVMADQATLAVTAYARTTEPKSAAILRDTLNAALQALDATPSVLLLRDFHAENLIWLPSRTGSARIGLLDFQDAVAGPGAYDLASLIADARRDVAPELADRLIARYADATGQDRDACVRDVAILRVQRTLRILGVFARLSTRDGKATYIDLIPRVWGQLQTALADYGDHGLTDTVSALLPKPTQSFLSDLRTSCGTLPTP
ncbi:MAG: phosphotransferase [Pseudomonadota bacterium]